jgi:hypothetical protein
MLLAQLRPEAASPSSSVVPAYVSESFCRIKARQTKLLGPEGRDYGRSAASRPKSLLGLA